MIAGFDEAIVGMKVWETKTVTIEPSKAYWEYDPNKTQEVPLAQLPEKEGSYVEGDELGSPVGKVTIIEVKEDAVIIDTNHFLAGKTLIFDITVKEIK